MHLRRRDAVTAEELMRSRYSAYAKGLAAYLTHSWHPSTRPTDLEVGPDPTWLGLEIVECHSGGADDDTGTVQFVASFSRAGRRGELAEVSEFVRHDGRWVYLGEQDAD